MTSSRQEATACTAVVFGSGGARGWAHIGVLKAFRELDFKPDIVAGTSIGSIAAAVYAAGALDQFLKFSKDIDWFKATQLFVEFGVHRAGLIEGRKVTEFISSLIPVSTIEELPIPYAAVATDLETSEEVVFKSGSLIEAMRASISMPGVFTPVRSRGRYLVDGGLVNPLPINVVKAMGANRVVAVNINNNLQCPTADASPRKKTGGLSDKINLFDVFTRSLRIAEDKISLECIRNNPPDILIEPAVGDISTMDFNRAEDAVQAGYEATLTALSGGLNRPSRSRRLKKAVEAPQSTQRG